MKKQKLGIWEIIPIIIAIVTIIFQIFPPKNQQEQSASLILFFAVLLFILDWIIRKVKFYISQINDNSLDIKKVKEEMYLEKRFAEIEKDIAVIQSLLKNKKGNINFDPRIILIIILLVLFYLYLKSLGYFS